MSTMSMPISMRPPTSQVIVADKTPLFEVFNEAAECQCISGDYTAMVGCLCPCWLVGAISMMAENKFTRVVDVSNGSDSCDCGTYAGILSIFPCGMVGFNPLGALYAVNTIRQKKLGYDTDSQDCYDYTFCAACAVCADYRTAKNMVENRRR
jgi:hypothetical protein